MSHWSLVSSSNHIEQLSACSSICSTGCSEKQIGQLISLSCSSSLFCTDASVVNAVTGLVSKTGLSKSFSNKSDCSCTADHAILCSPCSWLGEGEVVLDCTKFVWAWFSTLLLLPLLLLGIGGNSGVFSLGSSLSESKSKSPRTLSK